MHTTTWPAPELVRPYHVSEFRAMGSPCRIVSDTRELTRAGADLVHDLEQRWSRFLPTSEISAVNASGGAPCRVSAPTVELFRRAEVARTTTGGTFNPFVHDRLVALGYGAGFDHGGERSASVPDLPIEILPEASVVRLPRGARFDPGGIGKGLAGDLVVEHLVDLGAETVQVELGGDVRVHGPRWTAGRWQIEVEDPRVRGRRLAVLELPDGGGAAATSSVLGATWVRDGYRHHHLIDPGTGWPSETDVLAVTTTSGELWWAEVVAKAALLDGSRRAADTIRRHRCAGLVLHVDGRLEWVPVATLPVTPHGDAR